MEPHLDCSDYWTRENTISKGGTVDSPTGLDIVTDNNSGGLTGGGTHQARCSY
jgi:hypothetical protein